MSNIEFSNRALVFAALMTALSGRTLTAPSTDKVSAVPFGLSPLAPRRANRTRRLRRQVPADAPQPGRIAIRLPSHQVYCVARNFEQPKEGLSLVLVPAVCEVLGAVSEVSLNATRFILVMFV